MQIQIDWSKPWFEKLISEIAPLHVSSQRNYQKKAGGWTQPLALKHTINLLVLAQGNWL